MRVLVSQFSDLFDDIFNKKSLCTVADKSFKSMFNDDLWSSTFNSVTSGLSPRVIDDVDTRHYEFDIPGATKEKLCVELDNRLLTMSYVTKSAH